MNDIYAHIALTLKNLRKERNWSLDKAASETGVSKAMLGQIERQESSPTVATLWKIASGFHTSFSSFISDIQDDNQSPLHRKEFSKQLHPNDKNIRILPLFPFDSTLNLEIFIIELLPGCEHLSPPHQQGVTEHVIVVDGNLEIFYNGRWNPLAKGEGLKFSADQSHGYRNSNSVIASFHNIIHY